MASSDGGAMDWFREHLHWALGLYWLVLVIVVGIAHAIAADTEGEIFFDSVRLITSLTFLSIIAGVGPGIIINGGFLDSEPFSAFNILLLIISIILSCIVVGWVLQQKNRSLTWLILLTIPFGFLAYFELKAKSIEKGNQD